MLFAENSTTLDPGAKAVVARAVANIRTSRATTVNVIGYTDSNGDSASNQLAGARARTVQVALQADLGRKVTVNSRAEGQADPVASNATAAGQQLNRRVAITTTTVPTTPSGAATTGPTASVAGLPLVGGGAVTPTAATGDLDVAGTAGDVLFAENSATLDTDAHTVIARAAANLRNAHATSVTVTGSTDINGDATTNTGLSLRRAEAARERGSRPVHQIAGARRPPSRPR